MRKHRHFLILAVLTATLFCDRMVQAAPELRPQVQQLASRIVGKLTASFQRVVPNTSIAFDRSLVASYEEARTAHRLLAMDVGSQPTSPFQFRLPPPIE